MTPKTKELLHWIFFALGTLAAGVGASLPDATISKITMGAGTALLAIAAKLRSKDSDGKPGAGVGAVGLVLLVAAVALAGCNKYARIAAGYRAVILVQTTGNKVAELGGDWVRGQAAKCRKAHGGSSAYRACLAPIKAKSAKIRKGLVGVSKLNQAAGYIIRGIERGDCAKAIKEAPKHLRPQVAKGCKTSGNALAIGASVVCALAKLVDFVGLFVPKVKAFMDRLRSYEGVICAL